MLNRIGFKNLKKLNFGLNIGILKVMSKNSVSSTQTATLNIWWHIIHKMTNFKKWKKCILGLRLGSGSKLNLKLFLNYKFYLSWKFYSLRPNFERYKVTWKKCSRTLIETIVYNKQDQWSQGSCKSSWIGLQDFRGLGFLKISEL